MPESVLDVLVRWFERQCDGDWEHNLGVRIETLDNRGWSIDIRLEGTRLKGDATDWRREEQSNDR